MRRYKEVKFTCLACGKKGIDRSGGNRKYCSDECRKAARGEVAAIPCKYNEGVCCSVAHCDKCVWNPQSGIAESRLNSFLNRVAGVNV